MTISVISNALASAYGSHYLGPRTMQSNTAAQTDNKNAQPASTADASKTDGNGTSSANGQAKSTNFNLKTGAASQASSSDDSSDDPTTKMIKQLERQLAQVMAQIQRLQASSIPEEQKAGQLQSLNTEASTLQAEIASLMQKQMEAAKGGVTA